MMRRLESVDLDEDAVEDLYSDLSQWISRCCLLKADGKSLVSAKADVFVQHLQSPIHSI